MKLEELKKDIWEDAFHIDEMLDTKVPVDSWVAGANNSEVGSIQIDGNEYHIIIEPLTFHIGKELKRFVNIAFAKIIDGEQVQTITNDSKSAAKIIGAIANAMRTRLKDYDYDAVVFAARNETEKRMRVYNRIASWYSKDLGTTLPNVELPNGGELTIVTSKPISDEEIEMIKKSVTK